MLAECCGEKHVHEGKAGLVGALRAHEVEKGVEKAGERLKREHVRS
jgi:hypothetical protein